MGYGTIHVGMMKTGTSSIQASLKGFVDDRWVWFADHRGLSNHIVSFADIAGSNAKHAVEVRRRLGSTDTSGSRRQFERIARELGERTLVMSSEGILRLPAEDLTAARQYMESHGVGNIRIVAYVRPPLALITSLARAKMGGVANVSLANKMTRYRSKFEKFDKTFGRENVTLWKFDPKMLRNACAVQDFCGRLGIDFHTGKIARQNESLSREAVALLYTHRKFIVKDPTTFRPQRLALVQKLATIGSSEFRFSRDLLRNVLKRNRWDIEWMEARLGESLSEPLGESRPGDIATEDDLLRPDPAIVDQLRAMLGNNAPRGNRGSTPEEVAMLVEALRTADGH